MSRDRLTSFVVDGERRQINDPDSPATARQLIWLNAHGCLLVGHAVPLSKSEAAYEVDAVRRHEGTA